MILFRAPLATIVSKVIWLFQPDGARREQIDAKLVGHVSDSFLGFDAIAGLVQAWRESDNGTFAWNYPEDTPAHTAFCRNTHVPRPPTRAVVEPCHGHRGKDFRNVFFLHDPLACCRIHAKVR